MWHSSYAVVLGAALAATASACSSFAGHQLPCGPPAFSVSPTTAKFEEVVTVAAPGADCDPRYGSSAQVQISVTDKTGTEIINTTAPMTDDGEFTYKFRIPVEIATGEAAVTAMPHNVDWCDDTGRNNRARGAIEFEHASCVVPVKTLIITPQLGHLGPHKN